MHCFTRFTFVAFFAFVAFIALMGCAFGFPALNDDEDDANLVWEATNGEEIPETSDENEMGTEYLKQSRDSHNSCVDENYLMRIVISSTHFVHSNALMINAYCPMFSSLPCGSEHYVLRVNDVNVSYKQFCQRMNCSRRVVKVNAVFSQLWEESEHGNNMNMFDARYDERV